MPSIVSPIRSVLTFCLAIDYLSNLFINSDLLRDVNLIILLVIIILSFTVVKGITKVIGYLSFGLSILILFYYQAPLNIWKQALQENLYLVVMFSLIPLLEVPIQFGGYSDDLRGTLNYYVDTSKRFYLFVGAISAILSIVVSLAIVPLVSQIIRTSRLSSNKRLLSSAISRGFSTCMIWSPTTGAVALTMQLTGVKWTTFFPYAIVCAILAGIVGYLMSSYEQRRKVMQVAILEREKIPDFSSKKVIELSVFVLVLIFTITIISLMTGINTINVVSIVSLLFPAIWLVIIRRFSILLREFKGEYFRERLPRLKNEIILFVGAGLLATSITYSQLGNYVPKLLSLIVGHNIALLGAVIIFITLILSSLGVHPIMTVAIIGGTVKAASYGVSPTYMALILTTSWAMGITTSPASATVIAVSGLTDESPFKVGPRWNGAYAIVTSTVIILAISLFRVLGMI